MGSSGGKFGDQAMLIEAQPLDFTVIGAPRAGAAWLASILADHPTIAVRTKPGTGFFADRHPFRSCPIYNDDSRILRRQFCSALPDALLGEVAPLTYFDPLSASRQSNMCPDSHVFVLLRNPIEMLHSLYRHGRLQGWWSGSFENALSHFPNLLDLAFYDRHLTAYRDWFPTDQLHIIFAEEMFAAEFETVDAMLDVLEVERDLLPALPDSDKVPSLLPTAAGPAGRWSALARKARQFVRPPGSSQGSVDRKQPEHRGDRAQTIETTLSAETRLFLLDELDADISRFETSFGIDLTHWRTNQPMPLYDLPDNVIRLPVGNRAMAPA